MPNVGASPIDPATPAGQLRLLVGDTNSRPLDPPRYGFEEYATWSDDALEAVLLTRDGNMLRAAGDLYAQLASEWIMRGKSIKTDDLAIDTRGRGNDLLVIAKSYYAQADGEDAAGANDFFQIVPFTGATFSPLHPEGGTLPLPAMLPELGGASLDGGTP